MKSCCQKVQKYSARQAWKRVIAELRDRAKVFKKYQLKLLYCENPEQWEIIAATCKYLENIILCYEIEDTYDTYNRWLRSRPLSKKQLAQYRELRINEYRLRLNQSIEFTCDKCKLAPKCHLAFDSYNTNGNCLYEK